MVGVWGTVEVQLWVGEEDWGAPGWWFVAAWDVESK